MKTYQITVRQLVMLAFVTAIFAAGAVVFYDRVGGALLGRLAGARVEEQIAKTSRTPVAGITDPSAIIRKSITRSVRASSTSLQRPTSAGGSRSIRRKARVQARSSIPTVIS